jgi:hypothetical protein
MIMLGFKFSVHKLYHISIGNKSTVNNYQAVNV